MKLLVTILDFIYWERPRNPRCVSCRRRYTEVGSLLVEVADRVFMCDWCLGQSRIIMDAEKRRRGLIPPIDESIVNSPAPTPDAVSDSN